MYLHDLTGAIKACVELGSYTGSTDNNKQDVLMISPFTAKLKTVKAYFQGTANLVGGTATDYFTFVTYVGTVPIGTAGPSGTISFRTPLTVFSGTQSLAEGDIVSVKYGTVGGTAALNAPRSLVELTFEGA